MKALTFSTKAAADTALAQINRALGFTDGDVEVTQIGGGVHVPLELAKPKAYASVRKHPTRNEWAITVDGRLDVLRDAIGKIAQRLTPAQITAIKAKLASAAELPPDWTPPPKPFP